MSVVYFNRNMNNNEAHIYCLTYDMLAAEHDRHASLLDSAEHARADAFVFPEHRSRFITAHGVLRDILSHYTEIAPDAISYVISDKGKPSLQHELSIPWQFNLSHTDNCLAIAISSSDPVGVDIEMTNRDKGLLDLAKRFYASSEVAMLEALPAAAQARGFYRLWSLKEAVMKATGDGIAHGLDQWVFRLDSPTSARLSAAPGNGNDTQWSLFQHELPAHQCMLAAAMYRPNVYWRSFFPTATHA